MGEVTNFSVPGYEGFQNHFITWYFSNKRGLYWWNCPAGQEGLQKSAHEVGEKSLLPGAAISDREGSYPRESMQAIADAGYGAVTIPVGEGGLEKGFTAFAVLAESFAQYCPSTTMCWVMHTTTVHTIYEERTGEQKNSVSVIFRVFLKGMLER